MSFHPDGVDTLSHSSPQGVAEHGEGFSFGELLHHMNDGPELEIPGGHVELPQFPPMNIGGIEIDLSPTKHVVFLLIASVFLFVWAVRSARTYKKSKVPTGMTNVLEVLVLFIRDEVAIPNMGLGGIRYIPYLLTTFFVILIMNLLGLIPYGATATGNIAVTAGLAIIAFLMIQISAIRPQGVSQYLAHLSAAVHPMLWPIMVPIEIMGLFTKPFALCVRLFANMTGGHIVILSLIGLIFLFQSYVIGVGSVLFTVAIMMLELLVAFIQAYIFVMLTSIFMGLGMQSGHEEGHAEEHA
jgi:F-type H+-transporting ATPase subunit a